MTSLLTLRQRLLLVLAAGLLAGALIWGLRATGWLQQAELWQYDITTAALAAPEPLPDVTLVALTDADLARSGWPVSDTHLARLAEAALDAGARTVGIDLYRDLPVGEGRDRLLSVLRDPRVVVISRLADAETMAITAPLEAQWGFADVPIDPDGVARRALLLVTTQSGGVALSFPLKLAMNFMGARDLRPAPENSQHLAFGPTSVPPIETDTGPYARIDASGYQVITQYRHALPLVRRVRPDALLDGTAAIAGQLVIIGLTSDTVKDYFSTPLSRYTGADFTFGAEVHAAIAQQLIDYSSGRLAPLRSLQASTEAVLVFLTALAGAWCAVLWPARLYSLAAGCGGVLLGGPGLAYAQNAGLLLPAVPASLAWATAFIAAFIVVATLARRHRRIMVELFASQLSEDLSAEIWNQRDRLLEGRKPVSRKLFVTVLLADIERSTETGKAMEAEAFMAWISTLLDHLSHAARDHGGFVEKFTGDGILVVFGAPVPDTTPDARRRSAAAALACAKDMQRTLSSLNTAHSGPPYRLRIGLNSGEVIAGTLGVPGAMRYNIIGDTVNVAARVESHIKTLAPDPDGLRPIAMTAATADLLDPAAYEYSEQDLMHDDGKNVIGIRLAR